MGETAPDEWYLICTIACFLKSDGNGDFVNGAYLWAIPEHAEEIEPEDFLEGTFEPLAYMTRDRDHDTLIDSIGTVGTSGGYTFVDEVRIVDAAHYHIKEFGSTHIPFLVMRRVRDGFELPIRVLPQHGRRH